MANKYLSADGLLYLWSKIKAAFVSKEAGKGLSTNDYTNDEKTKLAGLSNYTLPTASTETLGGVKVGTGLSIASGVLSADETVPAWGDITDKPSWIGSTKPSYTAAEVGAVATTSVGQANGVASLGSDGKVPSAQLPSYVDDVVEGYYNGTAFYTEQAYANVITGATGKIYVDIGTYSLNSSYRYGGSTYVLITSSDMTAITNAEIDTIVAT